MILKKIHNVLESLGFERIPFEITHDTFGVYRGNIECNNRTFPVEIIIKDKDFIIPPTIRLLDHYDLLKCFQAHLNPNNSVCYFNKDSIVLDRYNISGHIKMCIEQARITIDKMLNGESLNDILPEFLVYWDGWPCLLDYDEDYKGPAYMYHLLLPKSGVRLLAITNSVKLLKDKLSPTEVRIDFALKSYPFYIFKTVKLPFVRTKDWPPKTLGQFCDWLNENDDEAFNHFCYLLFNKLESDIRFAYILKTPSCEFGIFFTPDRIIDSFLQNNSKLTNAEQNKITLSTPDIYYRKEINNIFLKNYIFEGNGKNLSINRFSIIPFDIKSIHNRNTPTDKGLSNKQILLIGCGTIGSFLAELLAKQGAGSGKKGKFILIDMDIIGSENISRYALGMKYLYMNKALVSTVF